MLCFVLWLFPILIDFLGKFWGKIKTPFCKFNTQVLRLAFVETRSKNACKRYSLYFPDYALSTRQQVRYLFRTLALSS